MCCAQKKGGRKMMTFCTLRLPCHLGNCQRCAKRSAKDSISWKCVLKIGCMDINYLLYLYHIYHNSITILFLSISLYLEFISIISISIYLFVSRIYLYLSYLFLSISLYLEFISIYISLSIISMSISIYLFVSRIYLYHIYFYLSLCI